MPCRGSCSTLFTIHGAEHLCLGFSSWFPHRCLPRTWLPKRGVGITAGMRCRGECKQGRESSQCAGDLHIALATNTHRRARQQAVHFVDEVGRGTILFSRSEDLRHPFHRIAHFPTEHVYRSVVSHFSTRGMYVQLRPCRRKASKYKPGLNCLRSTCRRSVAL